jgi:hypothetical protein
VDLTQGLDDLVAVALVAALAPLVVAALPGPRIPQVVIFLLGGVLIGPHVLGLAESSSCWLTSGWASCSCWPGTSWIRGCCGSSRAGSRSAAG